MFKPLLQSPSFDLSWDARGGTFRLGSPGRLLEFVAGVEVSRRGRVHTLTTAGLVPGRDVVQRLEDVHGPAGEAQFFYQEVQGLALSMRVRLYPGRPFALIRLSVTNVGPGPVHLRRFFIRTVPEGIAANAAPVGFYVNGWQSWSPAGFRLRESRSFALSRLMGILQGPMIHNAVTPRTSASGRFWSETVGALVTEREALLGGIASTGDQFGQTWADLRPGHQRFMVQTQMDDVSLAAGESRYSEWFYIEWVPLPCGDPFAQYAHAVARQMAVPNPGRALSGWCSWYVYGHDVSEAEMMENLASAALIADEVPLRVVQLDDGYQAAWGDWRRCNERFPHSLAWLAERIRGSGFQPGLWFAPFLVERGSQLAREHPDWLLRGPRGHPVRAGWVWSFMGRALDVTHPDVQEFLADMVRTFVHEWGYEYLKLDFLYAAALPGLRHNRAMTRAQALRQALRVIREAAGEDVYLLGCGVPLGPAIGLLNAVRVGPDTAPHWEPLVRGVSRFVRGNPALPSLRNSLRNVMTRGWMHGRWWVNDPDVAILREEDSTLSLDEVLAQLTLIGMTGGQIFLSDDLDDLPEERRRLVAALLPPLLDGMDTLDLLEQPMPEVVVAPVARPWGRWRLVAVFNWGEDPIERPLPESIPLDERKAYHIVDFWEQRYFLLGPGGMRPVLHIAPHGVVLLGVRVVKPEPHLVSSTFHISQGAEISGWELERARLSFTMRLDRVAEGTVWLALPRRPSEVLLDGEPLGERAVRAVASGIWSISYRVHHVAHLEVAWPEEGREELSAGQVLVPSGS